MTKLFGRGVSTNNQLVKEQKRQAAEAERKNAELKARRETAFGDINAAYDSLGDTFYGAYRDAITGYYQPQLDQQFQEANKANLMNFARRGAGRSTAFADAAGKIAERRAMAGGQMALDADRQTAGLRSQVEGERAKALGLAAAVEDPTQAVNSALTEVNAIQMAPSPVSPLGDVFQLASLGYQGASDLANYRRYLAALPTANPYRSSGKVVG